MAVRTREIGTEQRGGIMLVETERVTTLEIITDSVNEIERKE